MISCSDSLAKWRKPDQSPQGLESLGFCCCHMETRRTCSVAVPFLQTCPTAERQRSRFNLGLLLKQSAHAGKQVTYCFEGLQFVLKRCDEGGILTESNIWEKGQ